MKQAKFLNKGLISVFPNWKDRYPSAKQFWFMLPELTNDSTYYDICNEIHNEIDAKLTEIFKDKSYVVDTKRRYIDNDFVIFVLWYQGYEEMPELSKQCYKRLCKVSKKKVILLTKDNLHEYVDTTTHIYKLVEEGNISMPLLSDYIRLQLLSNYYCCWFDSTLFVLDIPDGLFTNEIYFPKSELLYAETDSKLRIDKFLHTYKYMKANYLLGGTDNRLYCIAKQMFEDYFKKFSQAYQYFFMYDLLEYVIEHDNIVNQQFKNLEDNNSNIEYLMKHQSKFFDKMLSKIKTLSATQSLFKLTYKNLEGIRRTKTCIFEILEYYVNN